MTKPRLMIEFRRYDLNPETGDRDGTKVAELPWPWPDPKMELRVLTVDGPCVLAPTLPELADKLAAQYGREGDA